MRHASRPVARSLALLLSLACAAGGLAASGCSGTPDQTGSGASLSQQGDATPSGGGGNGGNRPASNVEIVDGRLYWGLDETLWSAELTSSGRVRDMEPLMEFDEEVDLLAAGEDALYVCCYDGIWAVDPEEGADGTTRLVDVPFAEDFWVTPDALLYQDDDELWRSSLDGGDPELIGESVVHFAVLGDTVYYVDDDGTLRAMGLDGSDEHRVAKARDEQTVLMAHDGALYLAAEDEELCVLEGEEVVGAGLSHDVGDPDRVIFSDDAVFYYASDESRYSHSGDGDDEELPGGIYFWGYLHGRAHDGFHVSTISGDEIGVFDLSTYDYDEYEVDDGSEADPSPSPADEDDEATSPSSAYDIAEGLEVHLAGDSAVLTTAHLSMLLDDQEVIDGLWVIEPESPDAISFSYSRARESGYDGWVFTLQAYDWADNSYADRPNYRVAGLSEGKKYVVLLPTDVRYDASSTQQREEYGRMLAHAESMDANRNPSGNPLTILDP